MRLNPTSTLATLAALGLLCGLAVGTGGCSDDDGGACADVINPCDTPNATSCSGNTVQTCSENADGCLAWTDTLTCGTNASCTDGGCLCNDQCAQGDSQCSGDVIQLCAEDADGCFAWVSDTDCADSGQSCDDVADAVCVDGAGCGNDVVEGTELCDGTDLAGQTCLDEGFAGGTLACNATCDAYDTSGCTSETCGDGVVGGTELCDGTDLAGQTCLDEGFAGGTLACNATCDAYDTSGCLPPGALCTAPYDITGASFPVALTGTFEDDPATGFGCEVLPANVAWFQLTPTDTGLYTFDATNNTSDNAWGRLALFEGTACDPYGTELMCEAPTTLNVSGSAFLTAGTTYLIAFSTDGDSYTMVDPELDVTYTPQPPGNHCTIPIDISSATFPHQEAGTFSDDPVVGFSCDSIPTNTIWYQFTAPSTGTFDIAATNATTTPAYSRLVVLETSGCDPYGSEVTCVDANDTSITASVSLTAGTTYLIAFFTDGEAYTMVDPSITLSPSYSIDWCNLQWPQTATADEYTPLTTYGRLYIAGVTDQSSGPDTNPAILAQAGVGPDGSDPSASPGTWSWFPATANTGFVDGSNDEYMADLLVPPGASSPYDLAYRFSGNGGISWTYCDTVDNSYTVGQAGDLTVNVPPASLIISEYVEGTGNDKALEFYNATTAAIDLSTCQLRRFNNGSTSPSGTYNFPVTVLQPSTTFVVCHSAASAALTPYCDELSSTPVNFNGDDALELWCASTMVDSFGKVGEDPGSAWGTAPETTANATLRRIPTLNHGDLDSSDTFDPAYQWLGFPTNTFDGLGTHP